MKTIRGRLWAGLACLVLAAGCGGAVDIGTSASEEVQIQTLPSLPGCDAARETLHGRLSARPIAASQGLWVIYSDGRPLCIDTLADADSDFGTVIVSSNPMPGTGTDQASSNPMPGDPDNPAASNPMPGIDPGASNPMPGTDPSHSR